MNPYDEYPTQDADWGPNQSWEGNPYHAHISWESRDCDGQYNGGHIFRSHERREWDDWLELFDLLIVSTAHLPDVGPAHMTIDHSNKGGYQFHFTQETEEGYRTEYAQMCQDPWCDLDEDQFFRDHTAESMGY